MNRTYPLLQLGPVVFSWWRRGKPRVPRRWPRKGTASKLVSAVTNSLVWTLQFDVNVSESEKLSGTWLGPKVYWEPGT